MDSILWREVQIYVIKLIEVWQGTFSKIRGEGEVVIVYNLENVNNVHLLV